MYKRGGGGEEKNGGCARKPSYLVFASTIVVRYEQQKNT